MIMKSNGKGFGLTSETGPATFARWTLETESMFFDIALYLEHSNCPVQHRGAFGEAQDARHQLFNAVKKKQGGRSRDLRILKEPDTLVARRLLEFFAGFEFKKNDHVYQGLVTRLAEKKIHFNIPCANTTAKQKNENAHRLHQYTMSDMRKLAVLYLLRDEICGRPCHSIDQFCRALFTRRGSIYVKIFYCVVARANMEAAEGAKQQREKYGEQAKKASTQTPELFGKYLMPLLDCQHAVCCYLYGLNKHV
jgi:hypothetical protein